MTEYSANESFLTVLNALIELSCTPKSDENGLAIEAYYRNETFKFEFKDANRIRISHNHWATISESINKIVDIYQCANTVNSLYCSSVIIDSVAEQHYLSTVMNLILYPDVSNIESVLQNIMDEMINVKTYMFALIGNEDFTEIVAESEMNDEEYDTLFESIIEGLKTLDCEFEISEDNVINITYKKDNFAITIIQRFIVIYNGIEATNYNNLELEKHYQYCFYKAVNQSSNDSQVKYIIAENNRTDIRFNNMQILAAPTDTNKMGHILKRALVYTHNAWTNLANNYNAIVNANPLNKQPTTIHSLAQSLGTDPESLN